MCWRRWGPRGVSSRGGDGKTRSSSWWSRREVALSTALRESLLSPNTQFVYSSNPEMLSPTCLQKVGPLSSAPSSPRIIQLLPAVLIVCHPISHPNSLSVKVGLWRQAVTIKFSGLRIYCLRTFNFVCIWAALLKNGCYALDITETIPVSTD